MMNIHTLVHALIAGTLIGIAGSAACAQTGGGMQTLGAKIASQGGGNGVAACASCHGAQGEGNAAAGFPRLAGQPRNYVAHQLASYADGSRNNPVMAPIAKGLSTQEINAVAAYYAGLSAPVANTAAPPATQALRRGQVLANVGDNKLGVQGCTNCHGPGGSGEPPNYPYLSGQSAGYLSAALTEWRNGARKTDPSTQMNIIAKRLTDRDIAALSAYYASQPAPAPETQRVAIPAHTGKSGATTTNAAATPATGTGTEQGQPSSGGSQGPGGGGAASGTEPSGSETGSGK